MRRVLVAASLALAWAPASASAAPATVVPLDNQPPQPVGISYLMTDGTILAQDVVDGSIWLRFAPDANGSYQHGSWIGGAKMPRAWDYQPYAFAGAVLADGRLVVLGGEYNGGSKIVLTNKGAIYDPVANTWAQLAPPPGWGYIGDSPETVLPTGQWLVGRKLDEQMAMLDPVTLQWTFVSSWGKRDFNAEEGWTLMPDGSILTVDVKGAPGSERYLPSLGLWLDEGSTGVDLHSPPEIHRVRYGGGVYYPPGEVGPAILRPDGTVFAIGSGTGAAPGHTAVYHPSGSFTVPGTWTRGPDFPGGDSAGDSSAVLLPSGNVLVPGAFSNAVYEFDGAKLVVTNRGSYANALLMMLPSGEALVCTQGGEADLYRGVGEAQPGWQPTVTSVPGTLTRGSTYELVGTQLNGLSQAAGFGDELTTATNYPLVRLTNNATGHVFFARTHDHSTMGVATGAAPVSTWFDMPQGAETGATELAAVANGIASLPVGVQVR